MRQPDLADEGASQGRVGVQTPDQARRAVEGHVRAVTAPTAPSEAGGGGAQVIQLSNGYKPAPSDELPLMRQLLELHRQGKIVPEPVTLGPMPKRATKTMRDVAADMQLRLGLAASQGYQRPLMYAASEAEVIVGTRRGAAMVLHRLCEGVIRCVGEMPPNGQPRGTSLYVPPNWWPTDPEARAIVEATGKHPDASTPDLIWVPDGEEDDTPGVSA